MESSIEWQSAFKDHFDDKIDPLASLPESLDQMILHTFCTNLTTLNLQNVTIVLALLSRSFEVKICKISIDIVKMYLKRALGRGVWYFEW